MTAVSRRAGRGVQLFAQKPPDPAKDGAFAVCGDGRDN
jgi:hypothetical protein